MDSLRSYLTSPLAITAFAVIGLAYALLSRFSSNGPLPNLPWIGKEDGKLFAEARASIASFTNSRKWLAEGYAKYTKNGLYYIAPDFSGTALPTSRVRTVHFA